MNEKRDKKREREWRKDRIMVERQKEKLTDVNIDKEEKLLIHALIFSV